MQTTPDGLPPARLDQWIEMVSIGAGHGATALAQLLGEVCAMRVPRARLHLGDSGGRPWGLPLAAADATTSGSFFEVSGGGLVAWLLPEPSRRFLLERVTGRVAPGLEAGEAESALQETSNIVVSHFVSAMADTLGEVLVPSVPALALGDAPRVFAGMLSQRPPPLLRIETELASRSGRFRSGLCFARPL